jgi:hypothetical protein
MKRAEAEREVVREFDRWWSSRSPHSDKKPNGNDAMVFFGHLQSELSHLLTFKYGGDKWQAAHGMLLHAHRVTD